MRQVLDLARARATEKRAGAQEVRLAEFPDVGRQPDESLLAMDEALERLGQTDPLKVRLIEMRYFGGMTAEKSAEALSTSVHVVRLELRLVQAWLPQGDGGLTPPHGLFPTGTASRILCWTVVGPSRSPRGRLPWRSPTSLSRIPEMQAATG